MPAIGWTRSPVLTANTNRDGSGTVEEIEIPGGSDVAHYVDTVVCQPLGTNVASAGVLILNNGNGLDNPRNNTIIGRELLQATTLGAPASGDAVTYQLGIWVPAGYRLYALVGTAQAAGRQFTAFSDETYQRY